MSYRVEIHKDKQCFRLTKSLRFDPWLSGKPAEFETPENVMEGVLRGLVDSHEDLLHPDTGVVITMDRGYGVPEGAWLSSPLPEFIDLCEKRQIPLPECIGSLEVQWGPVRIPCALRSRILAIKPFGDETKIVCEGLRLWCESKEAK